MSRWLPCRRRNFIKRLRELGFEGSFSGTRHQFMVFEEYRLSIPSRHEYSVHQLKVMLHEVEAILQRPIAIDEWNNME